MKSPIPILEADSFGLVILVVYSLCSFSLASTLHSRWLAKRNVDFFLVYTAVLVLTVAWGCALLGFGWMAGGTPLWWALGLPLGGGLGLLAERLDRAIVRRFARRNLAGSGRPARLDSQARTRVVTQVTPLTRPSRRGVRSVQSHHLAVENLRPVLWSMVTIAILEELVFRGVLVQLCFLVGDAYLRGALLLLTTVVFALSHIQFGWPHVWGKAPLGLFALLATLLTGSILPAILAHLLFNVRAWQALRNQPVINQRTGTRGMNSL
jgi:membrane protease YdiL (CAAX protease family)